MSEFGPRILVPVDGSEQSLRAVTRGYELAKAMGVGLDLVTVLDLLHVDPFQGYGMSDEHFAVLQNKLRNDILDNAMAKIPAGDMKVRARLLRGATLKTLLGAAEEEGVLYVVAGRTGKGVFERLVQGSVSRGLAAHSAVPVVVVP